jgi:hypothetical protein
MNSRGKKIFILLTVIVPIIAYSIIYYIPIIRNAPFKSTEFVSFQYRWGEGKDLVNFYDSATGEYQYLNDKDSLIKTNVKLRSDDILYLHHKANELGFWNFPDVIANKGSDPKNSKLLRYTLKFNYKRKSKTVDFVSDYDETPKLRDVAIQMKTLVEQTISDAEDRYNKKP